MSVFIIALKEIVRLIFIIIVYFKKNVITENQKKINRTWYLNEDMKGRK